MSFKLLSILAAALLFTLFAALMFAPGLIYAIFELEPASSTDVISRRAAMLFVGLGLIAWLGRRAEAGQERRAIALGFSICMAGLAILGVFEFIRGGVGPGVWLAISVEALFALGFMTAKK